MPHMTSDSSPAEEKHSQNWMMIWWVETLYIWLILPWFQLEFFHQNLKPVLDAQWNQQQQAKGSELCHISCNSDAEQPAAFTI